MPSPTRLGSTATRCANGYRRHPFRRQPRRPEASLLDPFKPSVLERWNDGCHNGALLLREVTAQGYRGSRSIFFAYITQLRKASGLPPKKRQGVKTSQSRILPPGFQVAWTDCFGPQETRHTCCGRNGTVERLCDADVALAAAIALAQEFAVIVRQRQPERLDDWLNGPQRAESHRWRPSSTAYAVTTLL